MTAQACGTAAVASRFACRIDPTSYPARHDPLLLTFL